MHWKEAQKNFDESVSKTSDSQSSHLKKEIKAFDPNKYLQELEPLSRIVSASKDIQLKYSHYLDTESSIEYFFKILRAGGHDKLNYYRNIFWREYLEKGLILQSWLILAEGSAEFALNSLEIKERQFARLKKSKRIDASHAVLLMRLPACIVAEWSHKGKCRFWELSNSASPLFFQTEYSREDLTEFANYVQQHYFSDKGRWQKDAAKWMAKYD